MNVMMTTMTVVVAKMFFIRLYDSLASLIQNPVIYAHYLSLILIVQAIEVDDLNRVDLGRFRLHLFMTDVPSGYKGLSSGKENQSANMRSKSHLSLLSPSRMPYPS